MSSRAAVDDYLFVITVFALTLPSFLPSLLPALTASENVGKILRG